MPPSFTWARACSNRICMEMRGNSKHLLTLTLEILPALSKLFDLYSLEWPLHPAVNRVSENCVSYIQGKWQLKGRCADRKSKALGGELRACFRPGLCTEKQYVLSKSFYLMCTLSKSTSYQLSGKANRSPSAQFKPGH